MSEVFGARLRQARFKKNLSANGLSQKSGVSMLTIYGYEAGQRNPCLYNAVCLADALGVSLDWLAGRDGK